MKLEGWEARQRRNQHKCTFPRKTGVKIKSVICEIKKISNLLPIIFKLPSSETKVWRTGKQNILGPSAKVKEGKEVLTSSLWAELDLDHVDVHFEEI